MSPLNAVARPGHASVAIRASLISVFASLFAWGLVAAFIAAQVTEIEEGVRAHEKQFVTLVAKSLVQNLDAVVGDLRFLNGSRTLRRYLGSTQVRNRNELQRAYLRFLESKQIYDRIDYVDEDGRVIAGAVLGAEGAERVPLGKARLKDRGISKDPRTLADGRVTMSSIVSGWDEGRGELPSKSLIRLGAPVFDGNGDPRGAVMLDYLARYFLLVLFDLSLSSHGQVMLLDADGRMVIDPNPGVSRVRPQSPEEDRAFAERHPDLWKDITSQAIGSMETDEGMFFYRRVSPAECNTLKGHADGSALPVWYVVSHVTPGMMASLQIPTLEMACVMGAVLMVIIFIGSWVIAQTTLHREETEAALRKREVLYRTLADNFPNGAVILLDLDLCCVLAKGKGLWKLGFESDLRPGAEILNLFPPEAREEIEMQLREALSGTELNFEILLAGAVHHVYAVPVKGEHGEIFAEMLVTLDITERKRMEEQLREAATVDALTGLLNRRRLIETAEAAMRQARRYGSQLCLCMCDIDYFKDINDRFGHGTGDMVLAEYGALLRRAVRETDSVGRYGGDEFSMLFPSTPLGEAVKVVERIRHLLNETEFRAESGETFRVTGSFGVAVFDPESGGVARFFQSADAALYYAKRCGRDRVEVECTPDFRLL